MNSISGSVSLLFNDTGSRRYLDCRFPIRSRSGGMGKLWIDRRENSKSLTWSSVLLAFEKTEGKPLVKDMWGQTL